MGTAGGSIQSSRVSPSTLSAGGKSYEIFPLEGAERLPYTLRILLENALRHGEEEDAEALAALAADGRAVRGDLVPARARAAAGLHRRARRRRPRRDARRDGRPRRRPATDQSAAAGRARDRPLGAGRRVRDARARCSATSSSSSSATASATRSCAGARTAFDNFKVVPPNTGIVHQVNLEYLARVDRDARRRGVPRHARRHRLAHDDGQRARRARLGRRRHRGGGGDARPAGLDARARRSSASGSPASCREGATATDLVLTVTEMLRKTGVVGKFVEYFGHGLVGLPLADRATIGNMSPEYGATCGFFPVDEETLDYLRLTGRAEERVALVEAYCKENLLWHDASAAARLLAGRRARPRDRRAERSPGRAGRRTACRSRAAKDVVHRRARDVRRRLRQRHDDEAVAETFPASDPTDQEPGHDAAEPEVAPVAEPRRGAAAHRRRPSSTARSSSSSTAPS